MKTCLREADTFPSVENSQYQEFRTDRGHRMNKRTRIFAMAFFAVITPMLSADQGGFTNTGAATTPPGTLTISGNSLTYFSADGTTAINATFTTSSSSESCSGGGKGGHITCYTSFSGSFSGALTVNGRTQAINGTTSQSGPVGGVPGGVTGYNSAYTPFYFTDGNARILRADDLSGTNAIAYGTQGSGVGQFYGPQGIALDSAGRIYIADIYNDRIVRIDDMNGTNWTSYGTYGTGAGEFVLPQSVSIDPAGHIWVLDGGHGLIRMDDMNGTNWTQVGSAGSGTGQFLALSSAPGFDALGRIYVADAGNNWIVRFDDLNFTNWTTLSQSQPIGPYIFRFGGPTGVVTDQAGKIYVASGTDIIRVDDMTGANWTSIAVGTFPPHTIAIDSSGMVMLGNGYEAQIVDSEATVLTSKIDGQIIVQGVYANVYGAVPLSLPSPRPSAIGITPQSLSISQNAGASSPPQPVTIANFGGSPLDISSVSASGAFSQTNNCLGTLTAATQCTVSVSFAPSVTGVQSGLLTIADDSGNAGGVQTVTLNGTGTAPVASVKPVLLSFSSQIEGTTSTAKTITLTNTGTGPLQVAAVTAAAPFTQTNTCTASIAPGGSCTISVFFAPVAVGSFSGALTITDNAGTKTVGLTGSASAQVTVSAGSLGFNTLAVGNTSAGKTVTLTNRGSAAISLSGIGTTGAFAIASDTCAASLAAGASCAVGVTFTPVATGAATGALTFTDSALNSPQIVSLSGTGSPPVTLSSSSLSFGKVTIGNTSSAKTVTLTNRQSVSLTFSSIGTSGPFAIGSNTCGTSLAAGASCAVGVTFTPTATGAATGTLTFTDGAANSPQKASLSGTGGAPVTLSAGTPGLSRSTVSATSNSSANN
jgi:sugar lactone lactonase YvrE